jgi:hypothetical protein
MRAFGCVYSTLRRQAVLAVIMCVCYVPSVSAQKTLSGESLAARPAPTECNLETAGAAANADHPYERNQLDITSALALGPERTISDARKRFE